MLDPRPAGGAPPSPSLAAGLAAPLAARVVRARMLVPTQAQKGKRGSVSGSGCSLPPPRPSRAAPPQAGPLKPRASHPDPPPDPLRRLAAAACAAFISASALLGEPTAALASFPLHSTTASAAEDTLLSVLRTSQAAGDAAVGGVLSALTALRAGGGEGGGDAASASSSPAARAAAESQAAAVALLQEVHDVVSQNYVDARGRGFDRAHWDAALDAALHPPPRDLGSARLAVRALLAFGLKGDPYTRYAPPAEFAGMARYDLTGVGLNLGSGDEFGRKTGEAPSPAAAGAAPALAGTPPPGGVWVVGLVPGSPAAAAGVAQGDRVLGVSGSGVGAGEAPGAVAARVRAAAAAAGAAAAPAAAPAAPVASAPATFPLEVAHPDGAREILLITPPFALPGAASADASPVSARTERDGELGVVRLDAFTARARADTVAALGELLGAGSRVSELALDLRGNRGGLVSEGVAVASLFLPPGAVVTITEGATPSAERVLTAPATTPTFPAPALRPPPPGTRTLPLAVWVDGRTASAAEIVAGALRGNCRAPLLGPGRPGAGRGGRTYGKGLIQSVYGLGDGSGLVLTVGKYLTPGRGDIDGAGLAADGGGAGGSGGEAGPRVLGACTVPPRN